VKIETEGSTFSPTSLRRSDFGEFEAELQRRDLELKLGKAATAAARSSTE